jgi:hypothetical protein
VFIVLILAVVGVFTRDNSHLLHVGLEHFDPSIELIVSPRFIGFGEMLVNSSLCAHSILFISYFGKYII